MKLQKIFLLLLLITSVNSFAQNASSYFPANTGYKWYFTNVPLDSNNNPQPALTRYRIDSFAVVENYKGLMANVVRIKDNLINFNQNTPYNDTNYFNFQSSNAWMYFSLSMIPDSLPFPELVNFFKGFENWYNTYRFAGSVNSEYTIVSKDTIISFDTISIPIRIKLKAKRVADENIQTVNGSYNCKKFVKIFGLYYRFLILEIPIVERPDTTWFAENIWMAKQVTPSVNVNLNPVGINFAFNIPGNKYELATPVGINNISSQIPAEFRLEQNYPNPFNPVTKIRFDISKKSDVSILIYDIKGALIKTLINNSLSPGTYEIDFNAEGFSSGTYFYRLNAGSFSETKRMTLLK